MGTYRLGTFPAINTKIAQDQTAMNIVKFVLDKFPAQYFTHIYVDSESKNANQFMQTEQGDLVTIDSARKLVTPYVRFTIRQPGNNFEDTPYNGIWNVNQAPGAHGIDPDLTGYQPILYDPYGTIISTNDWNIRQSFNMKATFQTKADQLAFLAICDNNIKHHYGYEVISDCDIVLPQLLMEYLRGVVYKREINMLNRIKDTEDVKTHYKQDINKAFMEYLRKYSNGFIVPYKIPGENGDYAGTVFTLKRRQRVWLRLEKPEPDEGTRKGAAYDNFTVEISGYLEYANIISFITSVPAIIRGEKNNWFILSSTNRDKKNYYHTIKFTEIYKEEREIERVTCPPWRHFYNEREVMMSRVHESFDFIDEILQEDEFPVHYRIAKTILQFIKNKEQFDRIFKIVLYKNRKRVPTNTYTVDEHFHFDIPNCDLMVPYYIDVFINLDEYPIYVEKMKQILKWDFDIDWDEPAISEIRKSHWNIVLGTAEDMMNETELSRLIKIDAKDFYIANPNYHYYIYTESQGWIDVTEEVLKYGFKKNLEYYIKDVVNSKEEFLPIDVAEFLIPNPNYTYYIKVENEKLREYRKKLSEIMKMNISSQEKLELIKRLQKEYSDVLDKDSNPIKDKQYVFEKLVKPSSLPNSVEIYISRDDIDRSGINVWSTN